MTKLHDQINSCIFLPVYRIHVRQALTDSKLTSFKFRLLFQPLTWRFSSNLIILSNNLWNIKGNKSKNIMKTTLITKEERFLYKHAEQYNKTHHLQPHTYFYGRKKTLNSTGSYNKIYRNVDTNTSSCSSINVAPYTIRDLIYYSKKDKIDCLQPHWKSKQFTQFLD